MTHKTKVEDGGLWLKRSSQKNRRFNYQQLEFDFGSSLERKVSNQVNNRNKSRNGDQL